ncbi:hypothetical protein IAT38_006380 [Cryptococcus sp. DSM 104549]
MPPVAPTPAMKHFLSAERFAVIGRVMTDPEKWDNKILQWYKKRGFPVTPVRPDNPSEPIDGLEVLSDPKKIPSLPETSVSIIINPTLGLPILQSLFPVATPASPEPEKTLWPRAVWFQPGADNALIWNWINERRLEERFVGLGACVWRDGDQVLKEIKEGKGKL